MYMHGLLKSAELYKDRLIDIKTIAESGFNILSLLYNETHRINRIYKKNNFVCSSSHCLKNCQLYRDFLNR